MGGSLEDKLKKHKSPAHMLQNSPIGKYVYPIPTEFTNWVDEQNAWRNSVVLFDQTFHMTDLYVKGPGVKDLLKHVAVNSFETFGRDKAKQFICCNYDGYLIGDMIIFGLEDNEVNIVGRPPVANWVQYWAETGDFDVTVDRDERTADNPNKPRKTYRFELQGPKAMELLEKLNEGGPLTTKFFNMGEITIAGKKARTLAHGMGGAKGLEFFGPWEDRETVLAAVLEAGKEFDLKRSGGRAYASVAAESGWIPSPLPAIYTGEKMKPYREWLQDNSFEAVCSAGGSFMPENVEEYYLTPWDLDYHRVIKFDHDFIGREALEKMANEKHRTKVTLVWDKESVMQIFAGLMDSEGLMPKIMEMPTGHYSTHPYDRVEKDGKLVGFSTYPTYSSNERAWISLAMVDEELADTGTKLDIIWGEPNGGSDKPVVEPHRQVTITAEAHPWPIHTASRLEYRKTT